MHTRLLTGPMFSGKTRKLVNELEKYVLAKKTVLFITPKADDRENTSHSSFVELAFNNLIDSPFVRSVVLHTQEQAIDWLKANIHCASAVFVDEFFMIDFDEKFFKAISENEPCDLEVIFAGLISDAQCKLFPTVEKVLPFFDKIDKDTAICMDCGEPANYSYFTGEDFNPDGINVDHGNYKCLCFKCYQRRTNGNTNPCGSTC